MSKLDDIFVNNIIESNGDDDTSEAKQQIKDLFNELIGEDEHISNCPYGIKGNSTCICPMWQQYDNQTRTGLRQKVAEL